MSVRFQIEEMPGYLAVKFASADEMKEIWPQFEWIGEFCKRANKNKLLLDLTGAPGSIHFAERVLLEVQSQDFILYKIFKVAVVSRPEQLDRNKFGETVARNRGVNVRVFTTVEDAEKWLLLAPDASRRQIRHS
jgi:hypothetical protein